MAILNGMGNGALSGAIFDAITGAVSSTLKVAKVAKAWDSFSKGGPWKNMSYHYKKHVLLEGNKSKVKNIIAYTNDAIKLWNDCNGKGVLFVSGSIKLKGMGCGGFFSPIGLIRSIFY